MSMESRTDCFSLVWEKPQDVYVAVRKSLRFERGCTIPNVPIEISSDIFSLETQKSTYLNPCHDAHVILSTLMRTASHYHSVTVLNKGEPCVRWVNSNSNVHGKSLDIVVDLYDVVTNLARERGDAINRWVLFLNLFVFGLVVTMFVRGTCEMRLADFM